MVFVSQLLTPLVTTRWGVGGMATEFCDTIPSAMPSLTLPALLHWHLEKRFLLSSPALRAVLQISISQIGSVGNLQPGCYRHIPSSIPHPS